MSGDQVNSKGKSVGAGSRLGIGLQVALSAALALVALLMINWLVARPGVRQRIDLTESGKNTLATATRGVIDGLEKDVLVEILYQPMEAPLTGIGAQLMGRVDKMLALVEEDSGGRVDVEAVDISDESAWRERALELRIHGFENGLVVSSGERRTFVSLIGDLALVDIGRPTQNGFIPPSVVAFTGERALCEAILDVTRGETRHAYFTFGFGELDVMEDAQDVGAGKLGDGLRAEGFRIHRWNALEDGPLPADCDVLGILGPEQAWPEEMRRQVEAYIDEGGRVVVAGASDPGMFARSDVPDLVERAGLAMSEGIVCNAIIDPATNKTIDGTPRCGNIYVGASGFAQHPMLLPFIRAGSGRGFGIIGSHQVRVAMQPEGGLAQVVASSRPDISWLDTGDINYIFDEGVDTPSTNAGLGILATSEYDPPSLPPTPEGLEAAPRTKWVVAGSSSLFYNAGEGSNSDLWRAMFNWVTDVDHRISISARDPDLRMLPRDDPEAIVGVVRLAQWWLPLGAFVVALVVAFLRSRGGPAASSKPREAGA